DPQHHTRARLHFSSPADLLRPVLRIHRSHIRPHSRATLFPYTTLFRSSRVSTRRWTTSSGSPSGPSGGDRTRTSRSGSCPRRKEDRKSTRLNSSHEWISYAVFCLQKKKLKTERCQRGEKGRRMSRQ